MLFFYFTFCVKLFWFRQKCNLYVWASVDSQPTMEETILVGDDLMTGPPSPVVPPEIASHVLHGVDMCDGILRNMFLCKPFFLISSLISVAVFWLFPLDA